MKFKMKQEPRSGYTNTGRIILNKILNNGLPEMDILVRESIQNSLDAALLTSKFVNMSFKFGKFERDNLLNCMPEEFSSLKNKFDNESSFLAISDEKTCGLLGDYRENVYDKKAPSNLYKLVYSFMRDKDDEGAGGGSWGVGKSAYYRCGCGLCFYYSRTYEANRYISKLVGAFIEDEEKNDSILGKKSSGIAYFGDIDYKNNISMPIYNEGIIKDFLSMFGIKPYDLDHTGTVVIIPFLDENKLLSKTINNSNSYWKNDVVESLKVAIQRWYYPRLNNSDYIGKYLKVVINDEKLIMSTFFEKMQELYNAKDSKNDIVIEKIYEGKKQKYLLGFLKYKKYSKEELDVCCPPNNEPNPYIQLDVDYDDDSSNRSILCYVRKPGMITNYKNNEFGDYYSNTNEYIIGTFVLNDDLFIEHETLGGYVRKIENSDHYEWFVNVSKPEFPEFSKLNPISKIYKNVKAALKGVFDKQENEIIEETSSTILQKKLGNVFMPPEDFGEKASIPPKKKREPNLKALAKSKFSVVFNGFDDNGNAIYNIETKLETKEEISLEFIINANSSKYTFKQWSNFGFKFPFELKSINFDSIAVGRAMPLPKHKTIDIDNIKGETIVLNNNSENVTLNIERVLSTVGSIRMKNNYDSSIKFGCNLILKPTDITYTFSIKNSFKKVGDEE